MEVVSNYRLHAWKCERLAEEITKPSTRRALLAIAASLRRAADEREYSLRGGAAADASAYATWSEAP